MKQPQMRNVRNVWDEVLSFVIALGLIFYVLEGIKIRSDLKTLVKLGKLHSTAVDMNIQCAVESAHDIWIEAPKEFVRTHGNKGNFRLKVPVYARTANLREPVDVSVLIFCGNEFHSIGPKRFNITKSWWTPTFHTKNRLSPACRPFMFDMNVTLVEGCGRFRLQGHEK